MTGMIECRFNLARDSEQTGDAGLSESPDVERVEAADTSRLDVPCGAQIFT